MIIEWLLWKINDYYSMKFQAQTMEPHGSSIEFHEGTLQWMFS